MRNRTLSPEQQPTVKREQTVSGPSLTVRYATPRVSAVSLVTPVVRRVPVAGSVSVGCTRDGVQGCIYPGVYTSHIPPWVYQAIIPPIYHPGYTRLYTPQGILAIHTSGYTGLYTPGYTTWVCYTPGYTTWVCYTPGIHHPGITRYTLLGITQVYPPW